MRNIRFNSNLYDDWFEDIIIENRSVLKLILQVLENIKLR